MSDQESISQPSILQAVGEYLKLVVASGVVILLVLVAFIGISNQWCILQLNPAALFFLLIFAVTLLAYLEALHYACNT
jgi:hypothetical protein